MPEQPKNLIPSYVSVGFGGDSDTCMFLSNSAAKIINGSPAEVTPRERPLRGGDEIGRALSSRSDLKALTVIVRDQEDLERLERIGISSADRSVVLIEDLELSALETRTPPPQVFELGNKRRLTPRCDDSLDEARTIAGRLFYALHGLTDRERLHAVHAGAARQST